MRLARNLVLSCEILTAHKLRTLLAVGGVTVGVAAVILTVSAGRGAEEQILARIRSLGTNMLIVTAGQTQIIAGRQRQASVVKTLLPSDAQAIARECPSVALASPVAIRKMTVQWESETASTNVLGLSPDGFRVRAFDLARGRAFDDEDCRAARRVAVLGRTAARNLCANADPVGLQIRIGRVPFEVIGVLAGKGMDPSGTDQDDVVLVPIETALRRLLNVTCVQAIFVQGADSATTASAEREISELLHQRHRLGEKANDFTIQNQTAMLEAQREAGRLLTQLVGGAAALSLGVGGVGILAVMLISVRQRTREIGLRRALGARRRDIRTQFLLESGLLAGTGGLAGILLGVGAALAASSLGQWEMLISWPAVAAGLVFSVFIGMAFGLYPAARAARLEPIQALRAE